MPNKKQYHVSRIMYYAKRLNTYYKIHNTFSGFTLIELLVSISVMAVVFGVVISSTAKVQQNARNAKRNSDLKIIQSALQQYYADNNFFPTAITGDSCLHECTGNGSAACATVTCSNATKIYLKDIPIDPGTSQNYCYFASTKASDNNTTTNCSNTADNLDGRCYFYKLHANMEGKSAAYNCAGASNNFTDQVTPN